jgi:hypothetical protein
MDENRVLKVTRKIHLRENRSAIFLPASLLLIYYSSCNYPLAALQVVTTRSTDELAGINIELRVLIRYMKHQQDERG